MPSQPAPTPREAAFAGSIPANYDRYLGPMLFEGYARDLATRVRAASAGGSAVLEVAAGTGIVTEQLDASLPKAIALTVTDLNAPMLDVAQRRPALAASTRTIQWRTADALDLPFNDTSFDCVVCQFGVMFFPEKPRAARETFRVLRPGASWVFNVWGSLDENPGSRVAHETLQEFFPNDPPGFFHVPFGFHDRPMLRELVLGAGFEEPEIVDVDLIGTSPSAFDAAMGFLQGTPVATAIEERGMTDARPLVDAAAKKLAAQFGDKPFRSPMRARVVVAKRPA
jgi:ubiquinone/menaquinone biosynthesis C-methylase UbiE